MKVRLEILFKLFFCVALAGPGTTLRAEAPTKVESVSHLIKAMPIEEKIGQLLMVGFSDNTLTPSLKNHITFIKPGFLLLFKRNISTPSQTLKLIYGLENTFIKNKFTPPILSVDQEGGDVVRIPTSPPIPTALAVGELKDESLAKKLGSHIGNILNEFHIFMNLAPVLDLTDYSVGSFIQTRSYGSDPKDVSIIARSFIEGLSQHHILSTAKHFPGIGYTTGDSHKNISFADLTEEEIILSLEPYKILIKDSKLDAVMMTHHIYKNIDSLPATFSPKVIHILRGRLGFKGIILTDDVEMAGAKIYKTPEARAVEAFLAGNDVIMVAWNKNSQQRAYKGLLKAYRDGIITPERLNQSLERILTAKLKTPAFDQNINRKANLNDVLLSLKSDDLKKTIDEILIKKIEQEYELLVHEYNFPNTQKKYLIFSSDPKFVSEFKKNTSWPVRSIRLSESIKNIKLKIKEDELVIFYINGPKSTKIFNSISKKIPTENIIVVNSRFRSLVNPDNIPVLQIQMKHPLLGKQVAELFSKNKARIPAQINSGF